MPSSPIAIPDHNLPDLLTLSELAAVLRVSKSTAYRLVDAREISFHRLGRSVRFRLRDVEAFIRQRRIESKDNWK